MVCWRKYAFACTNDIEGPVILNNKEYCYSGKKHLMYDDPYKFSQEYAVLPGVGEDVIIDGVSYRITELIIDGAYNPQPSVSCDSSPTGPSIWWLPLWGIPIFPLLVAPVIIILLCSLFSKSKKIMGVRINKPIIGAIFLMSYVLCLVLQSILK